MYNCVWQDSCRCVFTPEQEVKVLTPKTTICDLQHTMLWEATTVTRALPSTGNQDPSCGS